MTRFDEGDKKRMKDFIDAQADDATKRVAGAWTLVALLGAGGQGLEDRRAIARKLEDIGIGALVPEDDLPRGLAPSLLERRILSKADVELVFLNVQSWGSVAEFAQFGSDPALARKLRILVERKHHPIYGAGSSSGYLSDAYLTHEAVFGHVYMFRHEINDPDWLPTTAEIVLRIAERYRQWKVIS